MENGFFKPNWNLTYVLQRAGGNLQLYSEKKQHNAGHSKRGKQQSAMVDTRWKGMAGQTVKCGKSSCYAFCSL
ncbi:hypothetical protein TIFTF001_043671 [Ficus carica]|uniref:Uncharacterized protein n=1 Tax=Ficus carica TaxID=3494 RepID=A0AA87Z1I2_FICCA|nr:hypothetical protein TIFTF001_043671 [Ficus carica]